MVICLLLTAGEQTNLGDFSGADEDDASPTIVEPQSESNDEDDDDQDGSRTVVEYTRVSTAEQESDGISLESQREALQSIVENDAELEAYCEPIEDAGEPGTDFDRPGIKKVGRLAQKDEVEVLMVDTLDRLGREIADTLSFIKQLRSFGVTIRTRGQELDYFKPKHQSQLTVLGMVAAMGPMNRAWSAKRSRAKNFLDNKQWFSWKRRIPFGYKPDKEKSEDQDEEDYNP